MRRRAFDFGVIGGGPAGATAATLLARAGASVLLLEASNYHGSSLGQTLSPLIDRHLTQLGLRRHLVRQRHLAAPGIVSVWGSREPRVKDFLLGVHGSGWQVDRMAFDRMLANGAARAGATVRVGSRVLTALRRSRTGWALELSCQGKICERDCRFLIDATGRSGASCLSPLSPRIVLDRLIGVVWTGQQNGEWPYTLVESVDDGWFYAASLPGGRATVAYMTDSDLYRCGYRHHSDLWRRQLNKTTYMRGRLPRNADLSKLRIVSAASTIRVNPVGQGWCAVGDAAISHDPLSGLGRSIMRWSPPFRWPLTLRSAAKTTSPWRLSRMAHEDVGRHWPARQHFYATERRWGNSKFWQRRATLPTMRR